MLYNNFDSLIYKISLSVNERFVFCASFRFPDCENDFFNFSGKAEQCKGCPIE